MNILQLDHSTFIHYKQYNTTKKAMPCIIFYHGFMSDMNGFKAMHLEKFCQEQGYGFIRFDNLGCGQSSGAFLDQTITSWTRAANHILNIIDGPVILVGSSAGAWIATLSAMENPNKVIGIITLAAAFDFTENLIWNMLNKQQKQDLELTGQCSITSDKNGCHNTYPISWKLIEDGRLNLLLNKNYIDLPCPIQLIHGMVDNDVPFHISTLAAEKISHNNVVVKLLKNSDHRLSSPEDLLIITNSIKEITNMDANIS